MKLSMGFMPLQATMNSTLFKFWYCYPVVFIIQCLYVSSVRTQLMELYTFDCPVLIHILAVFGHHQVGFTITCMEKNTVGETSPSQLMY